MRKPLLFVLATTCCFLALGQQRYSVAHYDNKDGLPANSVTGLEWDSATSLLWIGTEGGLVRWDGSSFETAAKAEGRVLKMGALDRSKSRYYAVCEDRSIYRIEQGQVYGPLAFEDKTPGDTSLVSLIARDRNAIHRHVLPGNVVSTDPSADDFLAFENGRFYLYEDGETSLLNGPSFLRYFFHSHGEVFLISNDGLWRFDRANRQLRRMNTPGWDAAKYSFLRNDESRAAMFYKGTSLYRLQPGRNSDEWIAATVFDAMPADALPRYVRELPERGLIIIGDAISGIYILRSKSIRQLTDSTDKIDPAKLVTYAQALLPDGLVMSHCGLQYTRSGPVAGKLLPVQSSLQLARYGNYIYFQGATALFRYNLVTQTSEQFAALDGTGLLCLAETRGAFYMLSGKSVSRLGSGGFSEVYRFAGEDKDIIPSIYTVVEARPGTLLLGAGNTARFIDIDRKRTWAIKVSEKAAVRFLRPTAYGIYACTYGEGLFLIRNGKVHALPRDKSDYLRFAHAMVPDGHGFCYISTNNGLFKVSEKALEQAAITGAPVCYYYLGKEDGLGQTELNGGCIPAYLKLRDGTLSFPTMSGLAQLHPDSVRIAPPPGVLLVHATADGQAIDSFPARLHSGTRLLQFDVTIPFWGSPQNLYGWYRLRRSNEDAADAAWILFDPARQRQFTFTALIPDRYYFEVRTFNGFAPGQFAVRSFAFEVAAPWYATSRFILLWLLLAALLVWLTILVRTRQLRTRSQQLETTVELRTRQIELQKTQLSQQLQLVSDAHDLKERLISVISHNIITPLRYIHRATTMMRDDARSLDPALREKAVDSINDTSLELELLSVNLLNWIKLQHKQMHVVPERFAFVEIADHVRSLLGPVAKSKGQKILVDIRTDTTIYQFKDALHVILYNLLLNAIAHSGGTTTTISFEEEKDTYVMSVRDNGHGMPESLRDKLVGKEPARDQLKETENQGKGFGFIIIRDLVHFIGGRMTIESSDNGTTIAVRFGTQPH
ncbi:MAG: hypothetical protein EOO15_17570 [Chitinophagaceae bacterium]|nr:MAG: hypothetical protein EOO15_17570 [Chitinophagaceae bacterium]